MYFYFINSKQSLHEKQNKNGVSKRNRKVHREHAGDVLTAD